MPSTNACGNGSEKGVGRSTIQQIGNSNRPLLRYGRGQISTVPFDQLGHRSFSGGTRRPPRYTSASNRLLRRGGVSPNRKIRLHITFTVNFKASLAKLPLPEDLSTHKKAAAVRPNRCLWTHRWRLYQCSQEFTEAVRDSRAGLYSQPHRNVSRLDVDTGFQGCLKVGFAHCVRPVCYYCLLGNQEYEIRLRKCHNPMSPDARRGL